MAYMALIFVLSSMHFQVPQMEHFPLRDKGVHFLEYLILGYLCAGAALKTWPERPPLRALAVGVLIAAAWGLSDELHQSFVPGRSADIADALADTLGALAGATLQNGDRFTPARPGNH